MTKHNSKGSIQKCTLPVFVGPVGSIYHEDFWKCREQAGHPGSLEGNHLQLISMSKDNGSCCPWVMTQKSAQHVDDLFSFTPFLCLKPEQYRKQLPEHALQLHDMGNHRCSAEGLDTFLLG